MNKKKFFIDFDLTIVDSIKAFCSVYNILYADHPEFQPADYNKISSYDFRCICPLLNGQQDKDLIWGSKLFFQLVNFMDDDTYRVLNELNEKYQLIVCSIGVPSNIAHKSLWLEKHLPFIKDYVLISNQGCKMNKSVVNMDGAIFLDDIVSNLESSNAKTKALFGKKYAWNNNWFGEHCLIWTDVADRFL